MRRIHLFKAGKHTSARGTTLEFGDADVAAMAAAYDPALHEAPIVVGHPKTDAPAYGWVGSLSADAAGLFAEPREVEPAFAELVQAGRFKKVSVALYTPTHPGNPKPGAYYLKHVGFLGAQPPAVKGLKPVEFADADDDQVVTVEFAEISPWRFGWLLSDLVGLLRGARDYVVGSAGAEAAERLMPGATLQRVTEEAVRMQAEAEARPAMPEPFSAPPGETPASITKELRVTEEELAARERAIADREAAFAERDRALAEKEAAARRAEDAAFVAGLVKDGRLPQGLSPRVEAFMAALTDEGEVAFAEGERVVKEAPRAAFRALLGQLPKMVAFGEVAGGGAVVTDDPHALARAAQDFQEAEHKAGRSVTIAQAVDAVSAKQGAKA